MREVILAGLILAGGSDTVGEVSASRAVAAITAAIATQTLDHFQGLGMFTYSVPSTSPILYFVYNVNQSDAMTHGPTPSAHVQGSHCLRRKGTRDYHGCHSVQQRRRSELGIFNTG